jgi:hypothetical protein
VADRDVIDHRRLSPDAARGVALLERLAGDPSAIERITPAPVGSSGFAWLAGRRIDALLDSNPLSSLYERIWSRQRSALLETMSELEARGIEALAFKGVEFHLRYFGTRAIGGMADADILVRANDLEGTRAALHDLGYRHGDFDPRDGYVRWYSAGDVKKLEADHYELAAFLLLEPFEVSAYEDLLLRRERIRVPVWPAAAGAGWCLGISFDVHHGVATNISGDRFFGTAVPGTCGAGRSMSPSELFWFTISRWYSELAVVRKRSLRDLAYVLPVFGDDLDWETVLRAAADYELGAALYYPLSFMDRAFEVDVPSEVLIATDPRRTSRRSDWGWQLGPLLDFIEPVPL